jgi:hypothetical protein
MRRSKRAALTAAMTLAAMALAVALDAGAQSTNASPVRGAQSGAGGLPDWGGLWEGTFGGGIENGPPSLTAPYAKRLADYQAAQRAGEIQDTPAANCVPNGMPSIMTQPYPLEFLFTPGKVTVLIEAYSQWRQIFTDGREHPDDPDLTFNGHSIGHWEGDTLVVDTVGFTTDTALGQSFGMRHSDRMRIVERMHLREPDLLEVETTIHDPEALTMPWTTTRLYGRHRDWNLAEYVCTQNNRNFLTEDGEAGINLEHE